MNAPILLESKGHGVSILTLNRPEKRNALSIALLQELCKQIKTLSESPKERILILNSNGPVFCAGMDLQEVSDLNLADSVLQGIRETLLALYRTPLITIAAVHGTAIGGGAGLLSCCDFVVATEEAKIGFPELQRGIVPSLISPFLMRQITMRHVRELLLLGPILDAHQALTFGLINRIVSFADLPGALHHLTEELIKGGPQTTKSTKRLLDALDPSSLERDLETCMKFSLESRHSSETEEGLSAFKEKREPKWS